MSLSVMQRLIIYRQASPTLGLGGFWEMAGAAARENLKSGVHFQRGTGRLSEADEM